MNPIASTTACDEHEQDCFVLTNPGKLILTGNASATILYEGQTIGQLSAKSRTFETCLTGNYCIKWAKGSCADSSVHLSECDGCEDLFMTVVDNGDGTISGINVDGTIVTWAKTNTFVTIVDNGDGTITGTNVDGTVVTWSKTDTFVTIVDNGDGTITGTNVDGTAVTWDQSNEFTTVVDNGNGTISITEPGGTPIIASQIGFIEAGEGISITGTGTIADPQIISNSLCTLPIANQAAVDAAAVKLIAGCLDGRQVLMPEVPQLPPSDPSEQPCVPRTDGQPSVIPGPEDSQIAIDCDEGLWVYTCENGWVKTSFTLSNVENLDTSDVDDLCNDLNFLVWHGEDDCPKQRRLTLNELAQLVSLCNCTNIGTTTTPTTVALVCQNGQLVEAPIELPNNTGQDVFLERIQGALNGTVSPDANGDVTFLMSDGTTWTLNLPIDELGVNGATMTLNGVAPGQGAAIGPRVISAPGIVYEDDPDNILTFTSGGVVVGRSGTYIIDTEIGGTSGGFLESAVFINGVNFGLGFPNSGSVSSANVLGIQQAVLRLNAGDLIQTGVGLNIGANPTVGNLAVTYLGA